MFSNFRPIDYTERSNSPPPVTPIFTNKMQNGNGNGKRPLANDSHHETKKIKN